MLTRIRQWIGVNKEKNPKYDYVSIVQEALNEKELVKAWDEGIIRIWPSAKVKLPIYTEEVRQFWYQLMRQRPANVFKLKGFDNKWIVVQISSDCVVLQEVLYVKWLV